MASANPSATERKLRRAREDHETDVNVGAAERLVSVLGGGALALYALRRRGVIGTAAAAAGAMLIERGMTGHCRTYDLLNVSTENGYLQDDVDPAVERPSTGRGTGETGVDLH